MTEARIKEAFEGNKALERLYVDNESSEFYPDQVRAAKNFKAGYRIVTREEALNPKAKQPARRGRKPKVNAKGNSQPKKTAENPS